MAHRPSDKGKSGFLGGLFHRQPSSAHKKGGALGNSAPESLAHYHGGGPGDRLPAISSSAAEALVQAMEHLR